MRTNKHLWKFLFSALLIYIILALPVVAIEKTYTTFFSKTSSFFLGSFFETGFARYLTNSDPVTVHVQVGNKANKTTENTVRVALTDVKTRIRGYLPTILFVALILASPIPWRPKLLKLFFGFFLLTAFVLFKQWIHILFVIDQNPFLSLYTFNSFEKKVVEFGYTNIITTVGPSLLVAVLIWVLLIYRRKEMSLLLNPNKTTDTA